MSYPPPSTAFGAIFNPRVGPPQHLLAQRHAQAQPLRQREHTVADGDAPGHDLVVPAVVIRAAPSPGSWHWGCAASSARHQVRGTDGVIRYSLAPVPYVAAYGEESFAAAGGEDLICGLGLVAAVRLEQPTEAGSACVDVDWRGAQSQVRLEGVFLSPGS